MSHLRPEPTRKRHRRGDCRKGMHQYGPTQEIGAGIARRVCLACSAVSIDLSDTYEIDLSRKRGLSRRAKAASGQDS